MLLRNLFIPWTVSTRISCLAYDVNIPRGWFTGSKADQGPKKRSYGFSEMFKHLPINLNVPKMFSFLNLRHALANLHLRGHNFDQWQ